MPAGSWHWFPVPGDALRRIRGAMIQREDRPRDVLEVQPTQIRAADAWRVDVDRVTGDRLVATAPAHRRLHHDDALADWVDPHRFQLLLVARRGLHTRQHDIDAIGSD